MLGFSSATFIPRPRPPQDSTAEPRKPRLRKDVTSRRFLVCHACVCTHTLTHMCFLCTRLSLPVRPYLCCDVRVRVLGEVCVWGGSTCLQTDGNSRIL